MHVSTKKIESIPLSYVHSTMSINNPLTVIDTYHNTMHIFVCYGSDNKHVTCNESEGVLYFEVESCDLPKKELEFKWLKLYKTAFAVIYIEFQNQLLFIPTKHCQNILWYDIDNTK